MKQTESNTELHFSGPAKYQLIIKGNIPKQSQELFGQLTIKVEENKNEGVQSFLEGEFLDQAELAGVLNIIYSLRLPLVGIKYIEPIK